MGRLRGRCLGDFHRNRDGEPMKAYAHAPTEISELCRRGCWDELAAQLVDGSVILGAWLTGEEALWVAARLPTRLRMDWVDGDWHVTTEGVRQ